jgi:ATHILA ORF-1 family
VFLGGVYLGIVFVLCCVGMSQVRSKRARSGASTSRANQAPVLDRVRFGSEKQAEEYPKQLERGHLGTRWYCEETAKELFMHEDIEEAFANMGASSLINMKYDTYGALTSEFLSSLETTVSNVRLGGIIKFRLGNEDRKLDLAEWCKIFGFWNFTIPFDARDSYPVKGFWARITGQSSVPGGANIHENDIASPLFRVIHRVLGNTLWAKKGK